MVNYFLTVGAVLRGDTLLFFLEISFVLAVSFSEQVWYDWECKSALVRPLFLCGFCVSFQINKDL
jgi:hypothetical protein